MNKQHTTILSAIVAMSPARVIGINNQLPWHLPADLRHFKAMTTGKPILMGRKTYQSIGRPLPNRTNLILTRDTEFSAPGCEVIHTLDAALDYAITHEQPEIVIIGGADLYQQLLPRIDRLYLTIVHGTFTGDAYFPEFIMSDWREISKDNHEKDNENPYPYSFFVYERQNLA